MWDFFNSKHVVAARDYQCAECGKAIVKGERHLYSAGKVEGHFESYRLCPECDALASAAVLLIDSMCEGWSLGHLREDLAEEGIAGPDYSDFLIRAMERRAADRVEASRELIRDRALEAVRAERERQITVEGYSAEHDDRHVDGSIGASAAAFLMFGVVPETLIALKWEGIEPGKHERRRRLVIGAALALAEIERIDRLAAAFGDVDLRATVIEGGGA